MDERTNCVVSDCTAVKMMKLPFILLFVLIVFIDYVLGFSSFYDSRTSFQPRGSLANCATNETHAEWDKLAIFVT